MEAAQTLADVTTAHLLNAEARADLETSSKPAVHNSLEDVSAHDRRPDGRPLLRLIRLPPRACDLPIMPDR